MDQSGESDDKVSDTLYFDGACPLCAKEISKLRRLDNGGLRCVDINEEDFDSQHHATAGRSDTFPTKDAMLKRLHVQTEEGNWLVGLKANIYAWRNTSYAPCWRILELPVIFPVASAAYELWAKLRYRQLEKKKRAQAAEV